MVKIAAIAFGLLIMALAAIPVVVLGAEVGSGFAIYFVLVGVVAGAAELLRVRLQRPRLQRARPVPSEIPAEDSGVDVRSVISAMAGPSSDAGSSDSSSAGAAVAGPDRASSEPSR